jgi:hypothetical protein
MKTDKLEQFVIENRSAFDDEEPGGMVWTGIEKQSRRTINIQWKRIGVRAAAVVVIFISSYYFHDFMQKRSSSSERIASGENGTEQNDMYHELQEAKYYYTSQVEEKRAEVFKMIDDNTDLKKEIDSELLDLDKVLKELKRDLKDNVNNEEVVAAMIQNYRLKLNILKDILNHLNSQDEKNREDETKSVNI